MNQPTCEQRIDKQLESTISELERMYYSEDESEHEEFYDYGLSFDYVSPNTFKEQEQGYFRYQLSWGGPSDEFRIYTNPDFTPHYIEYVFLDWFDGANRKCNKNDHKVIFDICEQDFFECGSFEHAFNESIND